MNLSRRGFLSAVAALLGIAVTAALTWSVSRLAGQRIGVAYTPLSAIHGLAPPRAAPADPEPARSAAQHRSRHPMRNPTPAGGARLAQPTVAPAVGPISTPSSSAPVGPAPAAAATTPSTSTRPASGTSSGSTDGGDHHDDSGGGGPGGGGSSRDD